MYKIILVINIQKVNTELKSLKKFCRLLKNELITSSELDSLKSDIRGINNNLITFKYLSKFVYLLKFIFQ